MTRTTTMTVRIGGELSDFVSANVGDDGSYENISEYIRDLIRRDKERTDAERYKRLKAELTRILFSDKERTDAERYKRLKAELTHAFAASEESYKPLTAVDVFARNRG